MNKENKKEIVYIPVHLEYITIKQRKDLIRDLAGKGFGRYGGTYSYQKKECRIKDILTNINNGKETGS